MDSVEVDTEQTVSLLRDAALALRSVTAGPTEVVRTVHAAINALQAVEAAVIPVTSSFEAPAADVSPLIPHLATTSPRDILHVPKRLSA